MPGTAIKSYDDGRPAYGGNHYSYPHPDSPSALSQFTTATRRDEMVEAEDPDAPVVIRVVAPATLHEGYTMDVLYEDEPYTIEIPRGGVEEGQEFETVIDPTQKYRDHASRNSSFSGSRRMQMDGSHSGSRRMQSVGDESLNDSRTAEYSRGEQSRRSGNSNNDNNNYHKAKIYDDASEFTENQTQNGKVLEDDIKQTITYPVEKEEENAADEKTEDTVWYDSNGTPMGGWRTRLCSCCDVLTQSTFWMGFLATPVLMAQLITRMKLTWKGREGSPEETSLSFNKLVLSLVFTMSVFWVPVMGSVCLFAYYLVVVVYVGSQVRAYMRQRYKIPSTLPTRCGDRIDDVCMMLFCGCCSTIQMARHTHDDKDHPGNGCTTTGLEFDAPEIV
mmetsp:Transcript_13189/g.33212  ORF Transcript_13189/g.33212 Transcript_13189/m.33212 type:complete len:389 (+) Transcript_13189:89-1255(+)